jgi:uncharacterized protein (TIGR02246 family)
MLSLRPRLMVTACALLVPFAVACEPPAEELDVFPAEEPGPPAEAPPAELESATAAYIAAWNGDDPEAVAPFFTEDAMVILNDDAFQGRTEIVEGWLPLVPGVANLAVTEMSVERIGDDWYSEGTYTATITEPDQEPVETSGHYNVTWTRDADGQWRIRTTGVHEDERADD